MGGFGFGPGFGFPGFGFPGAGAFPPSFGLGLRPGAGPPGGAPGGPGGAPDWLEGSLETLTEGLTTALLDFLGAAPQNTPGVGGGGSEGSGDSGNADVQRGPDPIAVGGLSLGVISLFLVLVELVTS